MLKPI